MTTVLVRVHWTDPKGGGVPPSIAAAGVVPGTAYPPAPWPLNVQQVPPVVCYVPLVAKPAVVAAAWDGGTAQAGDSPAWPTAPGVWDQGFSAKAAGFRVTQLRDNAAAEGILGVEFTGEELREPPRPE